jgi:hypothetical protein
MPDSSRSGLVKSTSVRINAPCREDGVVSATIDVVGRPMTIRHRVLDGEVGGLADGFLAAALLPAMAARAPVVVDAPVSPRLLGSVGRIQSIFQGWRLGLRSVPVYANPRDGEPPAAAGVAAFFSGAWTPCTRPSTISTS